MWHQHLCFVLSVGEFGMFDRNVRLEKLNALIICKPNPRDAMDANVRVEPLPTTFTTASTGGALLVLTTTRQHSLRPT